MMMMMLTKLRLALVTNKMLISYLERTSGGGAQRCRSLTVDCDCVRRRTRLSAAQACGFRNVDPLTFL